MSEEEQEQEEEEGNPFEDINARDLDKEKVKGFNERDDIKIIKAGSYADGTTDWRLRWYPEEGDNKDQNISKRLSSYARRLRASSKKEKGEMELEEIASMTGDKVAKKLATVFSRKSAGDSAKALIKDKKFLRNIGRFVYLRLIPHFEDDLKEVSDEEIVKHGEDLYYEMAVAAFRNLLDYYDADTADEYVTRGRTIELLKMRIDELEDKVEELKKKTSTRPQQKVRELIRRKLGLSQEDFKTIRRYL